MITPNIIINDPNKSNIRNIILKTGKNDNCIPTRGSWTPYDKIKRQMIITKVDFRNSTGDIDECALLSIGLSHSIKRISIILSLKLLLFVVKIENKRYSWIAVSLLFSIFTFLSVRYEIPMFINSHFKMMFDLTKIASITATTLMFVYKS